MTKNKSNKLSIVIAIVAVILILGGVYLLNESFSASGDSSYGNNKKNESVTYSVIDDDKIDEPEKSVELFSENTKDDDLSKNSSNLNNIKEEDEKTTTSNAASNNSTIEDKSDDEPTTNNLNNSVLEDPNDEDNVDTNKTDEDSNNQTETKTETVELEENQVLGKVVSSDGFNYELEIVQCGIPNATVCVPSSKLQLRALQEYTEIEDGASYILTGNIYEADGYIYVDTLDSVEKN